MSHQYFWIYGILWKLNARVTWMCTECTQGNVPKMEISLAYVRGCPFTFCVCASCTAYARSTSQPTTQLCTVQVFELVHLSVNITTLKGSSELQATLDLKGSTYSKLLQHHNSQRIQLIASQRWSSGLFWIPAIEPTVVHCSFWVTELVFNLAYLPMYMLVSTTYLISGWMKIGNPLFPGPR